MARGSFDVARLLNKRVILELDALTNSDKTFLIEALLLWIHHYRMGQTDREQFKHAVIIEEAHHILLRKKQEVTGEETVTDVLLREIRELGESIIVLDQHPSLISKPALGNTYVTLAMNLKHRGDIAMIKDCLLLDSEQAGYLGKLETGWAVTKLQGRWFKPFLVKFPLVTLDKGSVTDATIGRHMAAIKNNWAMAVENQEVSSGVISKKEASSRRWDGCARGVLAIPVGGKREDENGDCAIGLTTKEGDFLRDVLEYETSSITERYKRLHFSARMGNRVQKSLLNKGLISSEAVSLGKGCIKTLCLTGKGRGVLGYEAGPATRHGGGEHQYWRKKIAAKLRDLGYSVQEEYPIGEGKTVDIVAQKNGKTIAIEIETGKSDAAANVRKCLEKGFDSVWSVATTSRAKEAVAREVEALGSEGKQVKVVLATELISTAASILL